MKTRFTFQVLSIVILLALELNANAFEYIRPIPTLPKIEEPSKAVDVFTTSLATQIHATLFQVDPNTNETLELLVDSFSVSKNQLQYLIRLKKLTFHDGTPLTSLDVKTSMERAIKNKCLNFESLQNLVGFKEVISGKTPFLSGIKVVDNSKFKINLSKPTPELIITLSDIRFAIWKYSKKRNIVGLGPYLLSNQKKSLIELLKFKNYLNYDINSADRILIKVMNKQEATQAFINKEADDLFFYSVDNELIESTKSKSHQQKLFFPRTYIVGINSRLFNSNTRSKIIDLLNPSHIVGSCFDGEQHSPDLVPPGFIGHGATFKWKSKESLNKKIKINVDIVDSIGSEKCLKNYFETKSNMNIQIRSSIVPLHKFSKNWLENKTGVFVAWIEAESPLHYYGTFSPNARFPLLSPDDGKFEKLFDEFEGTSDISVKHTKGQKLAIHILSQFTIAPLFHPSLTLVYSKRFFKLESMYQSAANIPLTLFKKRSDNDRFKISND